MQLLKRISDAIYGTVRIKQQFLNDHPDETVLASDASKSVMTTSEQEVSRGLNWVTSQRAVVLLTNRRLVCEQWDIPLDHIKKAQLMKYISVFGSGQVLKITTVENDNFQFGMQLNSECTEQDALPLFLEKAALKSTIVSIVLRIVLLAILAKWLVDNLFL